VPLDVRDRIFLPYFSTKTAGMGLGLPIVHQIVSDHGGRIWVEDNRPRGVRFVIDLPASQPRAGAGSVGEAVDLAAGARPATGP